MTDTPKISPFLWFDNNAEEAIDYYTSIFKNSRRFDVSRYGEGGPGPAGSVMVAAFELEGQRFTALNGGPLFKFNEAISFVVNCDSQEEIDEYWEKLSAGGEPGQCGWLKDRFGLSWQIVPTILPELMQSGDQEKSGRVMAALMQMTKLEIASLQSAFDGA
ncbi:VOC family protein [Gimesia panareensis]|uniref:VOC family protein n=1 Tax=Gimesia panareensis TaxID=2527978 RepID=UPI00118B96AD|nr:VOC family protein [Gimesia panareensis]QDU49075.1 3-demethylubiquinone-9 3-methyltransferase [Gimesia panareensis]